MAPDLDLVLNAKPELVLQTGHSFRVDGLAFSPDGRLLATGSADNTVRLWDAASGRELRTLAGHKLWVKAVAFSPDGRQLVSGGVDGNVKVWNAINGRELRTLTGCGSVNTVAFSPDGKLVAVGNMENVIKLWDVGGGQEPVTLSGNTGWITALAFSPDGRTLASGSKDQKIKIWDVTTGRETRTLLGHTERIRALAFSPDGKTLASGGFDAKVKVWDAATWREQRTLSGHAEKVVGVAFSKDGKRLISVGANHAVIEWDAASGRELSGRDTNAEAPPIEAAAFNTDANRVAISTGDKTIRLWDLNRGGDEQTLDTFSSGVQTTTFSLDGKWFASGAKDHAIRVWEVATGRQLLSLNGHTGAVTALVFSVDGERLISSSEDHTIRIWDVATGVQLRAIAGHDDSVYALALASDGRWLASGGGDQSVRIWDLEAGRELRRLEGHGDAVTSLAASPDGRRLVSGSADGSGKLWEVATGKELSTLDGHTGVVTSVAFAGDGKLLATGSADNTVKVWDAASGREVRTLRGHSNRVNALAFSPNGKWLVSGGKDLTMKVWEASTGREAFKLSGHYDSVNNIAFTPDGRWFVSGSEDGTVRVWQTETGVLEAMLVSLRDGGDWLVTSPEGLFDGSPAAWQKILWRFEAGTFSVKPVEVFFNEFFYPGLLAAILDGKRPQTTRSIIECDRRQPDVKISLADGVAVDARGASTRDIRVKIEVAEQPPDTTHTSGSGARDVRLFRNGSLVRIWRGELKMDERGKTVLETTLPIVAGENKLSSYAFNRDNIKSQDAVLQVRGADSLRRKGTARILAIGVNEYANTRFNLRYAVADAQVFGAELERAQNGLGVYGSVIVTPIYDRDATKNNILTALRQLAESSQPEDAVVLFFAGHGVSVQSRFYLLPHDLAYKGERYRIDAQGTKELLSNGISDRELESALAGIDASQLIFVIDACNSGQVLEADEKRRGPMNSKGLAQLAYEKGMYILTAAQSYQAAVEVATLGHGLLTYVLVDEGLKTGRADFEPQDGQVVLREWLEYATERVPRMQQDKMKEARGLNLSLAFVEGEEKIQNLSNRSLQRPRAFYRSGSEARSFVVTRLTPSARKTTGTTLH